MLKLEYTLQLQYMLKLEYTLQLQFMLKLKLECTLQLDYTLQLKIHPLARIQSAAIKKHRSAGITTCNWNASATGIHPKDVIHTELE
jgi:hypothetical protein